MVWWSRVTFNLFLRIHSTCLLLENLEHWLCMFCCVHNIIFVLPMLETSEKICKCSKIECNYYWFLLFSYIYILRMFTNNRVYSGRLGHLFDILSLVNTHMWQVFSIMIIFYCMFSYIWWGFTHLSDCLEDSGEMIWSLCHTF